MFTAAVVTVSDRSFRGERADAAGPLVASILAAAGYQMEETVIVPDEEEQIREALILLPNRRDGSNICHVLRLPLFTAASKTALIKYIISEFKIRK